ncbi:TetR/AcrR family transcriptional regulator [Streptacidiphilus sp. N1-12]|uniref:TetR/AcrR family transcriptional regulator n=2 Tax=Streptacidiphilus alkalitolerans TaxID=3342712 RepID=A0ABV6VFQ1_9ACTN
MPPSTRPYDTSGRRAAAERNREAVVRACRELLERDGYQATTIRAVAARAGVSAEMVYKAFGGKQQLMKTVYDVALAGDHDQLPIGRRPAMRQVLATADPERKLALYAAFVCDLHQRLGGLLAVLAAADPELAEVRTATEQERLAGLRAFVAHLEAEGLLRPGLDPARAADACWALTAPQLFARLTQDRGWAPEEYRGWIADLLRATLL